MPFRLFWKTANFFSTVSGKSSSKGRKDKAMGCVQDRTGEDADTEKAPALIDNSKVRQALCP